MIESALVDTAIQILMKGLVDKVDTKVQYVLGFEDEFDKMKSELVSLQSYLSDVDKHKDQYKTLEDATAKLRELIYRIDDLVMDCQNRVDYEKMKNSYFSPISLRGLYFRNQIGKKLAEINREIVSMHRSLNIIPAVVSLYNSKELGGSGSSGGRVRWTSDIIDESQTVGLVEDSRTLKKWILPCNGSLQLIGIVGMGGLGKTTLAKKVYNDGEVCSRFDVKIWVCKSTFGELEIMKCILQQLKKEDHGSDSVLLKRIHEALLNKNYLIVMDDVWHIADGWWKRLSEGFPKTEKQSSCIIVTSRNKDVVKSMGVDEEQIHRPKLLSEKEGWLLFCKVAFQASKGKCNDPELKRIGEHILTKCGGLPLAIKTIGGLLSKSQLHSQWQEICDDLPQILANESKSYDSLMATLKLSYDELPVKLKQCILCFAIYPEDYEIDVDQLANWWIGEGFIYKTETKIARKMALECLSELVSRCLVEAVRKRNYDGRVYSCKMHDMIRDMIIGVAKEERFCNLDEQNPNIATKNSRRLGVTNETLFQPLAGNSKLRALLLTEVNCIGFTRQIGLAQVKSLRVLDLSYIKFEESSQFCEQDIWRWITSLKRLAYLGLRDVVNLTKLPRSINKLWGLQVLVLGDCKNLNQLPRSITALPKLIVLDLGNCTSLSYLPRGLSKLSHLQELYGFKIPDATTPNACHMRDLKDLRELRVLQLDVMDGSKIEEDELTVLEQFQQLRILTVNAGDLDDKIFLENLEKLSPPKSLEELYLRNFRGHTTPEWIAPEQLDRLQYLCIEDSSELQHISNRFKGSDGNKWKIEGLCLKYLPKLEVTWDEIETAMPVLKYVEVSHCNSLKSFCCPVKHIGSWRKPEEENEDPDSVSLVEEHHESHHDDQMN